MYLLEGNMGAGKSTLLHLIKKHLPHIEVIQESVDKWHNNELLAHFYQDQERWAYTMETFTLLTRVKEHMDEQNKNPHKIMERSIYSGYYCFAKNGLLQGTLSKDEWAVHNEWFNFLVKQKCTPPHGFIYLQTVPEVCFERMAKRNRSGEGAVPLEYLSQLHQQHEAFLLDKQEVIEHLRDVPVLTLEVSEEFVTNEKFLKEILNKIEQFVLKTTTLEEQFKQNSLS